MTVIAALGRRIGWIAGGKTGASAVVQSTIARFGSLVINLLTGIIVARALEPAGRGEQAAMQIWPPLISGIVVTGIPVSYLYFVRRAPERERELFSAAFLACVGLGLVSVLVGLVVVPIELHRYDAGVVRFTQLLMLFCPQILVQYLFQSVYDSRSRFSLSNQLRYAPLLVTLAALGIMWRTGSLTPISAAIAYFAPSALLTAWVGWDLREFFPLRLGDAARSMRDLFGYGAKLSVLNLINTFALQIDQLLVVGLLSPASLGIYTVALSASRVLGVFATSLNVVLFPKASSLSPREISDLAARSARISTAVATIAAVALIVVVPILVPLLYSKSFGPAIPITRVLVVEAVLSGTISVLFQAYVAAGRPSIASVFQLTGVLVAVPMLVILIPRFGLMGAAVALLLSTTCRLLVVVASFPKVLGVPMPGLVMTRADLVYLRTKLAMRGVG